MANIDLGLTVTFFNNASAGLKSLSGNIKQVGESAQATHNRLKAIQVVIAGILLQKSIQLGKAFLDMASANQSLDVRLAHFAGSLPKAQALMARLNNEFQATPFIVQDIADSWAKLQSVIGNSDRTTEIIEAITNDVAAMGGKNSDIDNVATAFQRLQSRGAASLRDMNALLQGTGITMQELAAAAGMGFTQFDHELRKGLLDADVLTDAFVKASKQKFGGYAEGLKFTMAGAWQSITNAMDNAVSDIGSRTDVFARLTVVFQNIRKAIEDWAKSITQADIDKFFATLASFEQPIRNIGSLMLIVGQALITVASITGRILSNLPAEVTEYGLIGYLIGGKKLALLGALIGYIDSQVSKLFGNPTLMQLLSKLASTNGPSGSILPGTLFSGDTAKIKEMLDMIAGKKGGSFGVGGDTEAEDAAKRAQLNYLNDLKRAASEAGGKLEKLTMEAGGDKLGVQIQDAVNQTNAWKDALSNILDKNKDLAKPLDDQNAAIVAIKDLIRIGGPIDAGLEKQKAQLQEINRLTQLQFSQEQAMTRMQLERTSMLLKRDMSQNVGFNLLSGTEGGQLVLDVDQRRFELLTQIEEAQKSIFDIQLQIQENAKNPAMVAELEKTKDAFKRMQGAATDAMQQLSASGELAKQVWKEEGQIIEQGVGDALAGVITHTKTLGQVATDVYAQITKAAANYIVKLAEIQLMGDSMGSGGSGGGGWIGSAAKWIGNLFANGGAFAGQVKPFARGDIISGPTLFGLAGEAGNEAIMPLTRIGGKLGVRAQGGGGETHIHIHAIDTQSGVEFLMKHASDLGGILRHRSLINREGH